MRENSIKSTINKVNFKSKLFIVEKYQSTLPDDERIISRNVTKRKYMWSKSGLSLQLDQKTKIFKILVVLLFTRHTVYGCMRTLILLKLKKINLIRKTYTHQS